MNEQHIVKQSMEPVNRSRPLGIIVAAAFTVIAGLAEVVTGFTHNFFGITTSSVTVFTGLYPTSSLKNTLSIIAGTVIVALVALYIGWKWKSFR